MKVGLLSAPHDAYDRGHLVLLDALYEGGKAFHAVKGRVIHQNAKEPADVYADRLKRVTYTNHSGPICDLFGAYLFSEAPQVELEDDRDIPEGGGAIDPRPEDEWLAEWVKDVDGRGAPLARWGRHAFVRALVGRQVFAWVNLPAPDPEAPAARSRAEQEARGDLSPYVVLLDAAQVVDWEEDRRGRLKWVMAHYIERERPDIGSPRRSVYRWVHIDATAIRAWEWRPPSEDPGCAPTKDDEATELPPVLHGFGRIPVARLRLPEGLWAMAKLADPATAHVRTDNDLDWALHRAAHALMVLKRKTPDVEPVVGPGYYLEIGTEDDVFFAEPGGAQFTALAARVAALREELYRVVHQMAMAADSTAPRSRLSGESKERDWDATLIVMSAYADLVRSFLGEVAELALGVVATAAAPAVSVKGLEGWQQEGLAEFLEAAVLAVEAYRLSPTFRRVVAKRQAERLLSDEVDARVMQTIRDEIDAAQVDDPAPYIPPRVRGDTEGDQDADTDGAA